MKKIGLFGFILLTLGFSLIKAETEFPSSPLYFVPNQGQVHEQARFYVQTPHYNLWMTDNAMILDSFQAKTTQSPPKELEREISRFSFLHSNPNPHIVPLNLLPHKVNYLRGKDPSQWITGIHSYQSVLYENLYPGIDLKIYGKDQQIEYDWIISPYSNPEEIRIGIEGNSVAEIDKSGNLILPSRFGEIKHQKPYAYQIIDGREVEVDAEFKKIEENVYGFSVGVYDPSRPLIIDPILVILYSTFLGGTQSEEAYGMDIDENGCVYLTGIVRSLDFPTVSAYQSSMASSPDTFIAKFNAAGDSLLYSTYLGGNDQDIAYGIAVDSEENIYICGMTSSFDFPLAVPIQSSLASTSDAFVAKLSANGSNLVYSTFLGGGSLDIFKDIAVDANGSAYVIGGTYSADFPVSNPFQEYSGGNWDAVIAKFTAAGNSLAYSTYLGGTSEEGGYGIAVDSSGNAYVTGYTRSPDFPTANPYQTAGSNPYDAFITKLSSDGVSLIYSTYFGGTGSEEGFDIALDADNSVYITGYTKSDDFPVFNPIQDSIAGTTFSDAFITKFNPDCSDLEYSTYLGGTDDDRGLAITVDSSGCAYIAGFTTSVGFPTENPVQAAHAGSYDAFASKISEDGSALLFSSYLGGNSTDQIEAIDLDPDGNLWVTGTTQSTNFPLQNPYQPALLGGSDAFLTKLAFCGTIDPFNLLAPADGAVDQYIHIDLDWEDVPAAETYDVYFGTSSPPPLAAAAVTESTYYPGALDSNQTYYWSVTAKNTCMDLSSTEWSFLTTYQSSSTISGTVYKETVPTPFPGVTITGLPRDPVTNASGDYEQTVLDGTYTVTPVKTGYYFQNPSESVTVAGGDHVGVNFVGYILTYSISGSVTENESGLSGVLVSGLPDSPVTGTDGSYSGTVEYNWIGTARPALTGYRFDPENRTYTDVTADQTDQDYDADLFIDTAASSYQVIPEVLWAPAAGGGTWMTEVQITDITGGSEVSVYFNSAAGERRGPIDLFTGTGPDSSVKTSNLLQTLGLLDAGFSYYSQVGAVEFMTQDTDHKIQVIAKTKNGNYSKTLTGLNHSDDNTAGGSRVMMIQNLANNDTFRTAYGGFNPTDDSITLEYELIDGSGNTIGTPFTKMFSGRQYQAVSVFSEAGVPYPDYSYENVWLKITPISGSGELMSYGATANNITSDPAVHIAVQAADIGGYNSPSDYQIIPEVIWAPAPGGGTWMTEMQITDITGGSQVSVYYNTSTGDRRGPITLFTGSGPGVSGRTANLLAVLDALDAGFDYYATVGTVEFVTQDADHKIQVMGRTANGNYSKTFQGLNLTDANTASADRTLMVQNLVNDDTYRTAFGAFNPTDDDVTVEFTLMDENGSTIGTSFSKTFTGREYQAFNPFSEAGVPYPGNSYENVWIKVGVAAGEGRLIVYGATANNITSDPAVHRAVQH